MMANIWMAQTLRTKPPIPLTQKKTQSLGSFSIDAPDSDGDCPKCLAGNVGRKIYIKRVVDERGAHCECLVCAHAWRPAHWP